MNWRVKAFLRGMSRIGGGWSRMGPPPSKFNKTLSPNEIAAYRAWREVKRHERGSQ